MASNRDVGGRWIVAARVTVSAGVALLMLPVVGGEESIVQSVQYIWPTTLLVEPFLLAGDNLAAAHRPGADPHATSLAALGEKAYKRFIRKVLPQQLKADKFIAKEFDEGDSGRLNLAFRRWQVQAFHTKTGTPIAEIDWHGEPMRSIQLGKYEFPELYNSGEFNDLKWRLTHAILQFFKRMPIQNGRQPMKIFPWFEVFNTGEWLSPHVHTGSPVCGIICLRCGAGPDEQSIVFVDPRGRTPPFGQTYEQTLKQGELLMFPSWLEHYITPLEGNATNVLLGFQAWWAGGAPDFDWEDDKLGDYTYTKTVSMQTKGAKLADGAKVVILNGEQVCEGHSYTPEECQSIGCCQYDGDGCMSAVGDKPCPNAKIPGEGKDVPRISNGKDEL